MQADASPAPADRTEFAPSEAAASLGTATNHRAIVHRIGVVGDTHLPRFGRRLPAALLGGLRGTGVELILHAGDLTIPDVVEQLEAVAPVVAVAGNNDATELVDRLGTARVVSVGDIRIGLTHGHLGQGRTTPERAVSMFAGDAVDVVVFGHSHLPGWERRGDIWLLNPGSPTDRRRMPAFSYAILEVRTAAEPSADASPDPHTAGQAGAGGAGIDARIVWYSDRTP